MRCGSWRLPDRCSSFERLLYMSSWVIKRIERLAIKVPSNIHSTHSLGCAISSVMDTSVYSTRSTARKPSPKQAFEISARSIAMWYFWSDRPTMVALKLWTVYCRRLNDVLYSCVSKYTITSLQFAFNNTGNRSRSSQDSADQTELRVTPPRRYLYTTDHRLPVSSATAITDKTTSSPPISVWL